MAFINHRPQWDHRDQYKCKPISVNGSALDEMRPVSYAQITSLCLQQGYLPSHPGHPDRRLCCVDSSQSCACGWSCLRLKDPRKLPEEEQVKYDTAYVLREEIWCTHWLAPALLTVIPGLYVHPSFICWRVWLNDRSSSAVSWNPIMTVDAKLTGRWLSCRDLFEISNLAQVCGIDQPENTVDMMSTSSMACNAKGTVPLRIGQPCTCNSSFYHYSLKEL